jgi:signal transduction histidine kinase
VREPPLRTLSGHFLAVGGALMIVVMLVSGFLISSLVARDAVKGTAAATALFMQAITADFFNDADESIWLTPEAIAELDALFAGESFRQRFPYLEIWSPDGRVIYSNSPELIGQHFPHPTGLAKALEGTVAAEYTDLSAREHTLRGFSSSYLEIYSPVRSPDGRVIAVAEIHEHAEPLNRQVAQLRLVTWLIVAASTFLIGASLFGVVHRGSRTIQRQEEALRRRVLEAEEVSRQNLDLRDKVRRASVMVSEVNEKFLQRIGADLHDGPTQLLSLAVLQASDASASRDPEVMRRRMSTLVATLDEVIRDIRGIARGLLMPEMPHLTFEAAIREAVRAHESRTGTTVRTDIAGLDVPGQLAVVACVFRFVQEGLANAYWHAGGAGQKVCARLGDNVLEVSVHNDVVDEPEPSALASHGMGLPGLRGRVESLGGLVTFEIEDQRTARLTMQLNLDDEVLAG